MNLNDIKTDDASEEKPVKLQNQASLSGQFGDRGVFISNEAPTAPIDTSMFKVEKGFTFVDKKGAKTVVVNIDRVPCLMIPASVLVGVGNKEGVMYKHLKSMMNLPLSNKRAAVFFQGLVHFYKYCAGFDDIMLVSVKPWHKAAVTRFLTDYSESIRHIAGYASMDQMAKTTMLSMAQRAATAASGDGIPADAALEQIKSELKGMTQLSDSDREQIMNLIKKEQAPTGEQSETSAVEVGVGVLDEALRRSSAEDKPE